MVFVDKEELFLHGDSGGSVYGQIQKRLRELTGTNLDVAPGARWGRMPRYGYAKPVVTGVVVTYDADATYRAGYNQARMREVAMGVARDCDIRNAVQTVRFVKRVHVHTPTLEELEAAQVEATTATATELTELIRHAQARNITGDALVHRVLVMLRPKLVNEQDKNLVSQVLSNFR